MIEITLTTAITLTPAQLKTITEKLEKKLSDKISVVSIVDQTVLGGICLTLGSQQLDGTLKHKLAQIKQSLLD